MKNFQVTSVEDGKKYWISRSCAVAAFIFAYIKDESLCVLANKRGKGAADFQGYWNCPCGYIDFDETAEQAASREIFEETGYVINHSNLTLCNVNSSPTENNQNITLRFGGIYNIEDLRYVNPIGGEENEVDEVKWILIKDINQYKWAFNHDKLILTILAKLLHKETDKLINNIYCK